MDIEFTYTQIKIGKKISGQFESNKLEDELKQNNQPHLITDQQLINLRQRYLRMLIARSYIAPQIIEKILDVVEQISGYRPDTGKEHETNRYSYYNLFFNQAQADEVLSYLLHRILTEMQANRN
jgi:hypothetical protein